MRVTALSVAGRLWRNPAAQTRSKADLNETGLRRLVDGRSAIRQLGCVNRLAGHDSEKTAGEPGARMAREIAADVCLTRRRRSVLAGGLSLAMA